MLPRPLQLKQQQAHRSLLLSEARTLAALRNVTSSYKYYEPSEEAIREAMAKLGEEFDQVLFVGRMDGRHAAIVQSALELDLSTIDAAAFTEEDRTRSRLVALSLASAIGLAALILLYQGKSHPLATAIALEDYRLRRAAATEVANAYSRAHYEVIPPDGWGRRWDAELDLKLCAVCRKMHGIIVGTDEEFPDGLVPGDVHPNCRCEPAFVPLSLLKAA